MTTTPLSSAQIADLTQLLQQHRRELSLEVDERLHTDGAPEVAVSVADGTAQTAAEADTSIATLERDLARLAEVCHALDKLAPDSDLAYGDCEACAEPIGYPRLLAHPSARRCLRCQTALERQADASARSEPDRRE